MYFDTHLLVSYNRQNPDLLIDCKCYDDYRDPEVFIQTIIVNRGSYMACLAYTSTVRKRVSHKSVPIMLGCYLDYRIRGAAEVLKHRVLWGVLLLKGLPKFYSSFSTFDSMSLHVREVKNHKFIDWFTYKDGEGLAIKYSNKVVTCTYRGVESTGNEWVELLRGSCPFEGVDFLESDYRNMFDAKLVYPYSMNDLKNRQIINGPAAMRKYIQYDMNRRKKCKSTSGQKMPEVFEGGTLYVALSKRSLSDPSFNRDYHRQNYDFTFHEGRSNKTSHLLLNVVRASNQAVRNSNALAFPVDGVYYFCMLNTKDLKSAGEQNVFADYVITSEETDQDAIFEYVKSIRQCDGLHILVINGYLVNCRRTWSLQDLIDMKTRFPHVTTQYYLPYIHISTRASIPIKYCEFLDTHFSPAETTFFGIKYPEADMLSITAKILNLDSLVKTPPAKSTVSINNIKGSIAMVTSRLHKLLMENSLGVTCYMAITPEQIAQLIDKSMVSDRWDTEREMKMCPLLHANGAEIFQNYWFKLDRKFNLSTGTRYNPKLTDPLKALAALKRMYPSDSLLYEYKKIGAPPYDVKYCKQNKQLVDDYTDMVFDIKNFPAASVWNLRLRAIFGNPFGDCILDGVVVDSNILKHIPPVVYNACITVEFSFTTTKQPKHAKFISICESASEIIDETLVGCLITEHDVYVKNSKHTKILKSKIGAHYFHLIHFLPKKTGMYDNLKIRHISKDKTITVVITGQTKVNVGIGSKVANGFGQKNIISGTFDMSSVQGVTRDGRVVHAQIAYSEVSLVSRVTSGQLSEMFNSPELAFTARGEVIAPVDLVLHTLHPYTNVKIIKVKNDTLTNINGFDSQNLSCASHNLRIETVFSKIPQIIGLHGLDLVFNDGEIPNLPIVYGEDLPVIYGEHGEAFESQTSPPLTDDCLDESLCAQANADDEDIEEAPLYNADDDDEEEETGGDVGCDLIMSEDSLDMQMEGGDPCEDDNEEAFEDDDDDGDEDMNK